MTGHANHDPAAQALKIARQVAHRVEVVAKEARDSLQRAQDARAVADRNALTIRENEERAEEREGRYIDSMARIASTLSDLAGTTRTILELLQTQLEMLQAQARTGA